MNILLSGRNIDWLGLRWVKASSCLTFFCLSYLYYKVNEGLMKLLFGLTQIIVGLCIDWSQLGKIASAGWQHNELSERLIFVFGAFAAIASGIKSCADGRKEFIAPLSRGSPATPNPR